MRTILVVDDEEKIRDVLVSYLAKEGYRTAEAGTGREALQQVQQATPDVVILDLMLPDLPGEEVCAAIRRLSSVPVLMLTAKVGEEERIRGLSLGADDYVGKPFSPREVVARVKALLRRSHPDELLAERIEFPGGLVIDAASHEVAKRGVLVPLTPNEYKLLLVLARHPLRSFTREELVLKVLGYEYEGDARTIDQHVKNLRQKLEDDPKKPQYVLTVYGTGYKFAGGLL